MIGVVFKPDTTRKFAFEQLEHRVLLSAVPVGHVQEKPSSQASPVNPEIQLSQADLIQDIRGGHVEVVPLDPFEAMEKEALETASNQVGHLSERSFSARATWSGDIPNGTVWAAGDVQRISGTANVPFGSTLTIQPGAIVKFESNATLTIFGDLEALGNAGSHVIFTSIMDDTVAGDTNGDGGGSQPAAGDWHAIDVRSSGSNLGIGNISNAEIRFGGKNFSSKDGAVLNDGGTLTVSNSQLSKSFGDGVAISSGQTTVADNTISDVGQFGVRADGSNPISITGNSISNALSGPIRTRAATPQVLSGNSSTGSGLANFTQITGGSIADARQWNDLNIYLSEGVDVAAGASLNIRPGLVVKYAQGQYMRVEGEVTALGTDAAPIIFTSFKDDSVGGDTNGDVGASTPAAGDWGEIYINGSGAKGNFDHLQLLYGGKTAGSLTAAIEQYGSQLTLAHSLINHSISEGVLVGSGTAMLDSNTISDVGRYGIRVETSGAVTLTSNTIAGAKTAPIKLKAGTPQTLSGNTSTGSGSADSIQMFGGSITDARAWDGALNYIVEESFTISPTGNLSLRPGLVVKFAPSTNIRVEGQLFAQGTDAAQIVLTSLKDDSVGGDANGDGASSNPAAGDWDEIYLAATNAKAVFDHAQVLYGGKNGGSLTAAFEVFGGELQLSHSIVAHSAGEGIWLGQGKATIDSNQISDVARYGIRDETNSPSTLTNNQITNAKTAAIKMMAGYPTVLSGNTSTGSGLLDSVHFFGGTITDAQSWNGAMNYVVAENFTIASTGSLTLRPGLIVKLGHNVSITLQGQLSALGTAAASIILTSLKDDAVAGDTNGDGAATAATAGDWAYLYLSASSAKATFDHARIFYSGQASNPQAAIEEFGGDLHLTNSIIAHTSGDGVWLGTGTATIDSNKISDAGRYGIRDESSNPVTLTNNQIENARTAPFKVHAGAPITFNGNTSVGSGLSDSIHVFSGTINGAETWGPLNYVLAEGITISSTGSLQIMPGVVIKVAAAVQIQVNGKLDALGTEAAPITFTSLKDDSVEGDTNGDGATTTPAAADWLGIYFNTSTTSIVHAVFRYAGQKSGSLLSALYSYGGDIGISDSSVEETAGDAIRIGNGKATLLNNKIIDATGFGLNIETTPGPVTMTGNVIENAQAGPLRIKSATVLTASNNRATSSGRNNAVYVEGGSITSANVWNDGFSTYLITTSISIDPSGSLQIASGRILKFLVGVVLKMTGGSLTAQGTEQAPIIFTSAKDDAVGGDTNGDGASTTPAAGDWDRIWVNNKDSSATLDHIQILYAGKTVDLKADSSISASSNGKLQLSNSLVRYGLGEGVWIFSGTGTVTNTTISDVNNYGIRADDAVNKLIFTNDAVSNAKLGGVYQKENTDIDLTGTNWTNSGRANAIVVDGGTVDGVRTWQGNTTYWLTDSLTINTAGNLTILPGSVLKFQKFKGVQISGTLNVPGNPGAGALSAQAVFTVTLTSGNDDIGGDTNGDAAATTPRPGDWFNVWQHDGSVNLNDAVISFAGVEQVGSGFAGTPAILKDSGQMTLRQAILRANFDVGLRDRSSTGKNLLADTLVIAGTGSDGISLQGSANDQFKALVLEDIGGAAMNVAPSVNWTLDQVNLINAALPALVIHGSGNIRSNWVVGQIPIVLFDGNSNVSVDNPGSLTFLPGTVVKLNKNFTLIGNAPVHILGDAYDVSTFTSWNDDSKGGDTNKDGDATAPAPGDWGTVEVLNPKSDIAFAHFQFGGGPGGSSPASLLQLAGGMTVGNIFATNSGGGGILTTGPGTVTLRESVIANNVADGIDNKFGTGGGLVLTNDTIYGNKIGVYTENNSLTVTNTIISGNSVAGVQGTSSGIKVTSQYNDFFNPNATQGNFFNTNIPNWNPSTPATDVFGNPLFVNPAAGDFTPGNGSPDIDSARDPNDPGGSADAFGNLPHNDTAVPNTGEGFLPYLDRGAVEKQSSGTGNDLLVTPPTLTWLGKNGSPVDPSTGTAQSVRINFDVFGTGTDPLTVPNFQSFIYLHIPIIGDSTRQLPDVPLGYINAPLVLPGGGKASFSQIFILPATSDNYYVGGVTVDSSDLVDEPGPVGEINNSVVSDAPSFFQNQQVLPGTASNLFLPSTGTVFEPEGTFDSFLPVSLTINPAVNSILFLGTDSLVPDPNNNAGSFPLIGGTPNVLNINLPPNPVFFVQPKTPPPVNADLQVLLQVLRESFINEVYPNKAGNTGDVTFRFYGGPFVPGDTPGLIDPSGVLVKPFDLSYTEDKDEIIAAFHLKNGLPGEWKAVGDMLDGTRNIFGEPILVVDGLDGKFEFHFDGLDTVRAGIATPFTFTYQNSGFTDLPAQLISIPIPDGAHISFQPNSDPITDDLQFMSFVGESTNYTMIPAQSSASLNFWITLDPGAPIINFPVTTVPLGDPGLNTPFDVKAWLESAKPAGVDPERWNPMEDAVAGDLGNTLGSALTNLAQTANLDPSRGDHARSPSREDASIRDGGGQVGNLLADKVAAHYTPPSNPAKGDGIHQDFVIVVAIEDYSHSVRIDNVPIPGVPGAFIPTPRVPDNLPGTQKDADLWSDFFSNDLNIPASQITVLRDLPGNADDNVTLEKIRQAWKDTAAKADADDKIKFVYSGHGSRNGGAMIMNTPNDNNNSRYVDSSKLLQMFSDFQNPGETYMVFDSCFSQSLGNGLNDVPRLKWNSAVGTDQTAADSPTFSENLVAAYRDKANDRNKDGKVYISEAFKAAQSTYNKQFSNGPANDQKTPHSGGDPSVDQQLHDDIGNATRKKPITERIVNAITGLVADTVKSITNVFAHDPNEKLGPAGFGPDSYLPNGEMPFTVYFENDAQQANAAAQVVTVTDQLDANLDWASFRFGTIGIGNETIALAGSDTEQEAEAYLVKLDVIVRIVATFDSNTGLATWTFSTLDPITHAATRDPLAGFLPPNVNKPEGEGHVDYTVNPKATLAHGAQVQNSAVIVFDQNAPIATNKLSYRIDKQAPAVASVQINNGLQRSRLEQIKITFNEDTAVHLGLNALKITNKATGQDVSLSGAGFNLDSTGHVATLTFNGQALSAGNYVLTVAGSAVVDVGGIAMAQDSQTTFHLLPGDANGDRVVNDLDLYRVWQNQLKQPANRDANEDLNADGQVDAADLNPVEDNFLNTLPAPQSAARNHESSPVAIAASAPTPGASPSKHETPLATAVKPNDGSASAQSVSIEKSNPSIAFSETALPIEPWQLEHASAGFAFSMDSSNRGLDFSLLFASNALSLSFSFHSFGEELDNSSPFALIEKQESLS
jgi:hypothetical protein